VDAPVYGLVLAGGRSTRMRADKAALTYQGQTQLERAMALLQDLVPRAFVSVRADQAADPLRARFARIVDRRENIGPIAGLLAAQAEHPHAAWLVLACDLPLLDRPSLQHLLQARDPARLATAYRSSHDGLPEPLCAIYEPASGGPLAAHLAAGRNCPRKFLLSADVKMLDEPNPRALDNINTPEEYGAAMSALDHPAAPLRVNVQYYALLREQAGRREEALTTSARTAHGLYQELCARYPFTLAVETLRVAVNGDFCEWPAPLKDGDAVVFIPPVAGG
jgi:molybdopterin-guanine dinucleotide biosynthesis protein A